MIPSKWIEALVDRLTPKPTEAAEARDYRIRLRQAAAKGWRLDESEARALTELSIQHGHIEPEKAEKLVRHLQAGQVMLTREGWVCEFCGGNCGQCGMTDFVGNAPFSFDRIASHIKAPGPYQGR